MKIAIDANEANVGSRVGTGEYTFQLLTRFYSHTSSHDFHLYLRSAPLSDLPAKQPGWHYHQLKPAKAWTRFALPLYLATHRPHDVFWNPAHYLPPLTRCKSVVTIHDLAYEFYPDLFLADDLYKLKAWTRRSVKMASRVIAVSASTKHDLINLYDVPENKISVVHNGFDNKVFNTTARVSHDYLKSHNLSPNSYILFVGTLQPRKNIIKLIQAFHLLKEAGYQGKLVIAGRLGWLAQDTLDAIRLSPHHDSILMTGYIDQDTKVALYRGAEVFVLPSLYEGFGVPVIEAMACGCAVAASDNSSLPEVVGEAGLLFDAKDPVDIAGKIQAILRDKQSWQKKSLKQAAKFSWDQAAAQTLKIIEDVAR